MKKSKGRIPVRKWRNGDIVVEAATKSEARAVIKRTAGLSRLPVGFKLVEVK